MTLSSFLELIFQLGFSLLILFLSGTSKCHVCCLNLFRFQNPYVEGLSLSIYADKGLIFSFDMMLKGEILLTAFLLRFWVFFPSKGQRGAIKVLFIF